MESQANLPSETELFVYFQAVFDTGVIIDTSAISVDAYANSLKKTLTWLQQQQGSAQWALEDGRSIHGLGDASDFLPSLNLSYVVATSPALLPQPTAEIALPSGARCAITFANPVVYFHTFSAGVFSLKATLRLDGAAQQSDLLPLNERMLAMLKRLVDAPLRDHIAAFVRGVQAVQTPIYRTPFPGLMPASPHADLFYWSHIVYVARNRDASQVEPAARWFFPILQPMNQAGITNQALKPDRFIYFGWGRSIISCTAALDDGVISPYVRMLEIRNYVWKTLYDLDRGLRSALIQGNSVRSLAEARRLVTKLHALDFRVKGILEELEPFKLTFDHEKIWLIQQADANWLTGELIASVESRLQAFSSFYAYNEEAMQRSREERLQAVLNLIGVVATAGAITEIINYFDPFYRLPITDRVEAFSISIALIVAAFYLTLALVRRTHHDQ